MEAKREKSVSPSSPSLLHSVSSLEVLLRPESDSDAAAQTILSSCDSLFSLASCAFILPCDEDAVADHSCKKAATVVSSDTFASAAFPLSRYSSVSSWPNLCRNCSKRLLFAASFLHLSTRPKRTLLSLLPSTMLCVSALTSFGSRNPLLHSVLHTRSGLSDPILSGIPSASSPQLDKFSRAFR